MLIGIQLKVASFEDLQLVKEELQRLDYTADRSNLLDSLCWQKQHSYIVSTHMGKQTLYTVNVQTHRLPLNLALPSGKLHIAWNFGSRQPGSGPGHSSPVTELHE